MNIFAGVTDNHWYDFLSRQENLDEVNFWLPSADVAFRALQPGELFLFKLHSPRHVIAGGGVFLRYIKLPVSLAWEYFDTKNGASSFGEMRQRILNYRKIPNQPWEDFPIGCILLTQPFFLPRPAWFPPPDWSPGIQRGKRYKHGEESWKIIWKNVFSWLNQKQDAFKGEQKGISENQDRYGKEVLIKPRLGQGTFRIVVTDAYGRSCSITKEKALPVLEAAHIKPYAESGPHSVNNGILLRSDMHKLFDKGYLTITPDLHVEISRRIKDEFDNGEYYYSFHGKTAHPPGNIIERPSTEFLSWHNGKVYRGR